VGVGGIDSRGLEGVIVVDEVGDDVSVVLPVLLEGSLPIGIALTVLGDAWADIASPSSVASRYNAIEASRAASSSFVKWPR